MDTVDHIVELSDFIREIPQHNMLNYQDKVIVVPIDSEMGKNSKRNPFPLQLNACTKLFVVSGELSLIVDYKKYTVKENSLVLLIERHILNNISVSENFKGYHIFVDNVFFKNSTNGTMPPTKGVVYNVRQYPVLQFEKPEFKWLVNNVENLKFNISRNNHSFQNSLIINNISTFVFEIWNKSLQTGKNEGQNVGEDTALRFFDLVFLHFKEQHEVSFYAEQLYITSPQLSRIVKNLMGKSALNVIHDIMLTEAKIQLRRKQTSIQQISDYLNFSDQASFSKFFKKNAGISPAVFRKEQA